MPEVAPDQRRMAKAHLLADLHQGCSVPEAHPRTTLTS